MSIYAQFWHVLPGSFGETAKDSLVRLVLAPPGFSLEEPFVSAGAVALAYMVCELGGYPGGVLPAHPVPLHPAPRGSSHW